MKSKYILDAVAKLQEAQQFLIAAPYSNGSITLAMDCGQAAISLLVHSGIERVEIEIEQPVDYVREGTL